MAGLHARDAHQVGVPERQRGAGVPHGAHRRTVRDAAASTACWCATRRRPSNITRGTSSADSRNRRSIPTPRCCTSCSRAAACASTSNSKPTAPPRGRRGCSSARMCGARCRCSRSTMRGAPVYVIGAPQLTQSYAQALARNGRKAIRSTAQGRAGGAGLRLSRAGASRNMMNPHPELVAILRGLTPRARWKPAPRWSARIPHPGSAAEFAGSVRHHQDSWRRRTVQPASSAPVRCSPPPR